jgi:hypothetical protein
MQGGQWAVGDTLLAFMTGVSTRQIQHLVVIEIVTRAIQDSLTLKAQSSKLHINQHM